MENRLRDLLKKLRNYEIRIRKAINDRMQGDFHSVFRGSGIEFDDIRAYQYGDDVRSIHWKASAKGHGTFIKTFREEKEQTVFFILDVSGSQDIGRQGRTKLDVSREICGVLSLAAQKEASRTGLLCYSDCKELYIKPEKGPRHNFRLLSGLFETGEWKSPRTQLSQAILTAEKFLKRRSVVILISDFIDTGYEHRLKSLAGKHDLVVIHIADPRETRFPSLGIIPVYDKEERRTVWINSSSSQFRQSLTETFAGAKENLQAFCQRNNANYLYVTTGEEYIPKLIQLFKHRSASGRKPA